MLFSLAVLAFHGGGVGDGVHGPRDGRAGDGEAIPMDTTATTTRTVPTVDMTQVRLTVMGTAMDINMARERANLTLPLDRK